MTVFAIDRLRIQWCSAGAGTPPHPQEVDVPVVLVKDVTQPLLILRALDRRVGASEAVGFGGLQGTGRGEGPGAAHAGQGQL
ncbi:hypothetical protein ABIB25_004908 [Nakamurella sp. UYEF19]|uniref:hypothetical protein n=1 Tax=Nakamurella sp. UYEF19 TaxID=1756392 RepID=UPI003392ECE8